MGQEKAKDSAIQRFVKSIGVKFKVFAKIRVNGKKGSQLFNFLKKACPARGGVKNIQWNFTKFLIDKEGMPVARYGPTKSPESMCDAIEKLLDA